MRTDEINYYEDDKFGDNERIGTIKAETERAILFKIEKFSDEHWLPLSQIKIIKRKKHPVDYDIVWIPSWLMTEKGIK